MSPGPQPITAAIALGSNLGDRTAAIAIALDRISQLPHTTLLLSSSPIETDPVGPISQPRYLNAAALIATTLPPRELLTALLTIERTLGRTREADQRWGPRTIDLDLLLYGDQVLNETRLTIPHPRLHERLFVLTPLASIAPNLFVPTLNATIAELRTRLLGTSTTSAGSN
jgi:2-amino-4-hydroxy-6-hydroxymethyldihydropteridine diphosphokinase